MRLTKIYTRQGDEGMTRLADGARISKNDIRVQAYGEVDELNSLLGVVLSMQPGVRIREMLHTIQHQLFNLGGELATAGDAKPLILPEMVAGLERDLDELNSGLRPLEEFILPGGSPEAAQLQLARTVCRRAERSIISLQEVHSINANILAYVNRLSDLLFVMARYENKTSGTDEPLWKNPNS